MSSFDTNSGIQSTESYTPKRPDSPPAPMGKRLVAAIIDRIILVAIGFILNIFIRFDGNLLYPFGLTLLVDGIYAGYFYSKAGATPGKKAMGIVVISSAEQVNFFQGALRDTVGKWISGIILMIGYLMALFRADGRALHDLMFDTRVVEKD